MLGRIPGTRRFSDCERHPDNELISGALIFRPNPARLISTWITFVKPILERIRAEAVPPKRVVLDLSAAPLVDLQAIHAGLHGG